MSCSTPATREVEALPSTAVNVKFRTCGSAASTTGQIVGVAAGCKTNGVTAVIENEPLAYVIPRYRRPIVPLVVGGPSRNVIVPLFEQKNQIAFGTFIAVTICWHALSADPFRVCGVR